jgi:hypothetical protein
MLNDRFHRNRQNRRRSRRSRQIKDQLAEQVQPSAAVVVLPVAAGHPSAAGCSPEVASGFA